MKAAYLLLLSAVLLATACDSNSKMEKKEHAQEMAGHQAHEPAQVEQKLVASETELAPEEPKTMGEKLAVPEDFEAEASKTVALENLEAELDRLEAEIVAIPN